MLSPHAVVLQKKINQGQIDIKESHFIKSQRSSESMNNCREKEMPGSNSNMDSVFIITATMIYKCGHGLYTPTAVPKLTQPCIIPGSVY